jgi:hypothetical protein
VYTPEKVYDISLYNHYDVMYSILPESYDQELLNKPSYMFLPSLVPKILLEQSKSSKHLTGFLRHCKCQSHSKGKGKSYLVSVYVS